MHKKDVCFEDLTKANRSFMGHAETEIFRCGLWLVVRRITKDRQWEVQILYFDL